MTENQIELRKQKYFKLNSQIVQLENAQLHALFDTGASPLGWGLTHTIVLGQSKIFIKRIPVTNLEYDNLFSTRNLYNLPTYFNYGLGSVGLGVAGLGVFRELITHIKTTNWVLAGEITTFPLMYHYRLIPFSGKFIDVSNDQLKALIDYWGNSENVGQYMLDRAQAQYELILFLEYIPHVLETWLLNNPHKLEASLDSLCQTIDFLRKKGVIHFDAHFRNVLTDGKQVYLTDFGLALDKEFTLTQDETSFLEENIFYDYGEILRNLGHLIRSWYDACPQSSKREIMATYGIEAGFKPYEIGTVLLDKIEQIQADGFIELDDFYVNTIVKYRSIIELMRNFFFEIWTNNRKDTKLPHAKLKKLLEESGFFARN